MASERIRLPHRLVATGALDQAAALAALGELLVLAQPLLLLLGLEGIEKATKKNVAGLIIEFIEKNAKRGKTRTRGKG